MSEHRVILTSIYISNENGDRRRVEVLCPDGEPSFEEWMTCAEFLLHLVATKSKAGFERAIELISNGAMTYERRRN